MSNGIDIERELRLQLGHDLHDGPLQIVVGAKMMLDSLANDAHAGKQVHASDLDRIVGFLTTAIVDLRGIVSDVRPEMEKTPWNQRLETWLSKTSSMRMLPVMVSFPEPLPVVSDEVAEVLYRVSCEAIRNAWQHSKATSLSVTVRQESQHHCLEIQDNGVGFDSNKLPTDHYGVRGMVERVTKAQGHISIESSVGQGTIIRVLLPLCTRAPRCVAE